MRFVQTNVHLGHVFLLLLISLPYFIHLGTSSIWDASEAFYAETPREMMERGDYLAPHFNFVPRIQKPPLSYWIIVGSYKLFGVGEFGVRFPGALAGFGIICFTYAIARLLFSPAAGLVAAAIAATAPRIFILARRLPIDIYLIFFLVGALYFLIHGMKKRNRASYIAAHAFLALGFLTKGPVALLIPIVSLVAWSVASRRLRTADLHLLPGILVFLIIVLPWYLLVFIKHGWLYIAPFLLKDNLGRFALESFGPSRGLFYYLGVGLSDFFPWSLLFLAALAVLWRCRRAEVPLRSLEYGLPLCWCLAVFVFFSLSKNKQEYYIAPLYPVAGILLAGVMDKVLAGSNRPSDPSHCFQQTPINWWRWAFGLCSVLLLLFSISTFYLFPLFMPNISSTVHFWSSLILIIGCVFLLASAFQKNLARCFVLLTSILWVMYSMCVLIYLPGLEEYRPVKKLCSLIDANWNTESEAGYYRTALPSMTYYLRRPIFEEHNLERMMRKLESDKQVFCIMSRKAYDNLLAHGAQKIFVISRKPRFTIRMDALLNTNYAKEEELLLITNRDVNDTNHSGEHSSS